MIGLYNYSVIFTFLGTICGITSIYFSTSHEPLLGIICLMLSGLFDMFDGMVARTRKNRSEFDLQYGIQLDSLSDAICFGAAPVFLALEICKDYVFLKGFAILYLVTAISRLAYFNVEEAMRRTKEKGSRKEYTGLPVTAIALILPFFYIFKSLLGTAFPYVFMGVLLLVACLQISKIKVPHLDWKGLITCLIIGLIIISLFLLI